MLLEPSLEASLGLTNVDLTINTRYFVNDVACFSAGRGSLTLVSRGWKVGPDLNTTLIGLPSPCSYEGWRIVIAL